MFVLSPLLDFWYSVRLNSKEFRTEVFQKAIKQELRNSKKGIIILRNLAKAMTEKPELHQEFADLLPEKNYQKYFWEGDLGFLWYQGNFKEKNEYFNLALQEISSNAWTSVLDIGCGWGRFCEEAAKISTVEKVKGIDISEELIKKCRANTSSQKIKFQCLDAMEEKEQFDLVTLFGSTDYLENEYLDKLLSHLITLAKKKIIIVNSLRGMPFETLNTMKTSKEVHRYDRGFVHPLPQMLTALQRNHSFTFQIRKFGKDSVLAMVEIK